MEAGNGKLEAVDIAVVGRGALEIDDQRTSRLEEPHGEGPGTELAVIAIDNRVIGVLRRARLAEAPDCSRRCARQRKRSRRGD